MSSSCIYEGVIRHRRLEPVREFSHRLALAYLDLEELPRLLGGRLVSPPPGLVRVRRSDYLGDPAVPLDRAVRDLVSEQTGDRPAGPIRLLTRPRSFGHCFNPVSFYYCFDPAGERVQALVAEVTNTPWGERHAYVLGSERASGSVLRSYSCAIFARDGMTLEQAQVAKLERVCEKLDLGPQDRVIEIGGGWGAFALYAARTRGCHVTTTTISREQHDYALARVRRVGLEDKVTVLMRDYRELRGRYDKLVSVEMIEAVGWRQLGTFFAKCSELLADHGAMLLQAITIDDRAYEVEKASKSFINTYIFPGGCLPSLEAITHHLARRTDMQAAGLEDLTTHYVETLRRWRANFTANAAALAELGYDERFRRIWTLYLAYCEAGFAERRICDIQLLVTKLRSRLAVGERAAGWGQIGRQELPVSA